MPRIKQAEWGKSAKFPELEEDLAAWITSRRQEGVAVSTTVICLKAKALARDKEIPADTFKASQSWCYKFLARNSFSIRCRTTVAQKLPENFDDKLINFHRFIIQMRQRYGFDLSVIGNADQTPLTFDIASKTTVSASGIKTVPIITTGHEKDRFTVMLACRGDGSKLPPYVVFKRKTEPLPGVLGSRGAWAFIFRDIGRSSNYFQGLREPGFRFWGSREIKGTLIFRFFCSVPGLFTCRKQRLINVLAVSVLIKIISMRGNLRHLPGPSGPFVSCNASWES